MQNKYGIGDVVMLAVRGTIGEIKFDPITKKMLYGIAIADNEFAYVAEDKVTKFIEK